MSSKIITGSRMGTKAICGVVDTDGNAVPLLATDNGDGTSTLVVSVAETIDPTYIGDIKFGESLPAGTNIIGRVGIDQTTPGTTNGVVVNSSALPTGAATSDLQIAGNTSLIDIKTLLQTTGVTLLPLSSTIDSIDVNRMSKGAITTAHNAITATATSAEIDCRGFNSLLVHWVSNQTDKTWTISVLGAMGSGLTFVPLLDKATGLAVSEITTDISGYFVINNVPDYVKIVATETDDGATVTCKVQPFNA